MSYLRKEYNQWELRFLQVLVVKEEYLQILAHQMWLFTERRLWEGTNHE